MSRQGTAQKIAISAMPVTTRAAPARRRGPTGSFRPGAAKTTAITTLDSRTAATDAADARRSAARVSPYAPSIAAPASTDGVRSDARARAGPTSNGYVTAGPIRI